jgi:hypothetical protein
MGIYYGYVVDLDKLKGKSREEFQDFIDKNKISLHTGYSVGAYEPKMAVLGDCIDGCNFLFGPTPVSKINLVPDKKVKESVDSFDLSLIRKWKDCLENTKPEVIIFDDTDD